MPRFLNRLAARALGVVAVAQPIVPPMFSPAPLEKAGFGSGTPGEETESSRAPLIAPPGPESPVDGVTRPQAAETYAPSAKQDVAAHANSYQRHSAAVSPVTDYEDASLAGSPLVAPHLGHALAPQYGPSEVRELAGMDVTANTAAGEQILPERKPFVPVTARSGAPTVARPALASATQRKSPIQQSDVLDQASRAPVIRVTIGRVDVRAEFPPVPSPRPASAPSRPSTLSLEQYARQRHEGKR